MASEREDTFDDQSEPNVVPENSLVGDNGRSARTSNRSALMSYSAENNPDEKDTLEERLKFLDEDENLLSESEKKEEEARAQEILERQKRMKELNEMVDAKRKAVQGRLQNVEERWRKLEIRRKARVDYYHAKIYDNNLMNELNC